MVTATRTAVIVHLPDERMAEMTALGLVPGAVAVRALHQRLFLPFIDHLVCDHCASLGDTTQKWPCPTARLVYSDDEIAALTTTH